jgi:hypothetical protein
VNQVFYNGTFQMIFVNATKPQTVYFQLRGPASVVQFPVTVYDAAGNPVGVPVVRSDIVNYTTTGSVAFRQEQIAITYAGGIGRIDIGMNGNIVLVDDVAFGPLP